MMTVATNAGIAGEAIVATVLQHAERTGTATDPVTGIETGGTAEETETQKGTAAVIATTNHHFTRQYM